MPRSAASGSSALFGAAIADRVIDLDEIQRLAAHDRFHFGVLAGARTGDADVADAAGGLLLAQQGQQRAGAPQVVQLDEIEAPGAERRERSLEALPTVLDGVAIELGREEEPVAQAGLAEDGADGAFGITIGGRGIDDLAAEAGKGQQRFAQARVPRRVAGPEAVGPDADDRQADSG